MEWGRIMTEIKWDDSLSVGIDLIDSQHKELINKIQDLSEAVATTRGLEKILQTLEFMIKYTEFHFGTEERHMRNLCYPGIDSHLRQHNEFVQTLNHMIEDFEEDGATKALSNSLNTYLINWLIKHIKSTDRKFGEFLKKIEFNG